MNEAFQALSNGTRREILQRLRERDMNAGEIASFFDMSKPSISHHLNVLKAADLVTAERHGQEIIYSLNVTVVQDLMAAVLDLLGANNDPDL